ncbi:PREDICTED: uncharacterized protein LOC104709998 [Camelina sativa]|uniref:Uncharacterized protein LOC104709998 n=1 Tax=Camelina sativa TaxID=90675 RepID=A0ABM1QCX6_CAMSA|nr:PREDICTED: uncharacterized protein LOC104709998 [Camelina sativa]
MDSGCTLHSTPDKEVLFDFKEFSGGRVLLADKTHGEIKGSGKIKIQNQDGSVVILKDVKYIPDVSRNLISYGMLEKSGCRYKGSDFMVHFYKDNKKVISGKYHDGLYYLQGTVVKGEVNVSQAAISGKDIAKAEDGVRKKKSKKVTFSVNLIQGPTPYGFERRESSATGGDSSSTEKSESSDEAKSEKSKEISDDQPRLRDHSLDRMHCDNKMKDERVLEDKPESVNGEAELSEISLVQESLSDKVEMKELREASRSNVMDVSRDGAKGGLALSQESQETEVKAFGISEAKTQFIKGLVSKGEVVLNKILTTIHPTDFKTQAVPGKDFQVCYDLLNIA